VTQALDQTQIERLLDPSVHIGLSADIARQTSARTRRMINGPRFDH